MKAPHFLVADGNEVVVFDNIEDLRLDEEPVDARSGIFTVFDRDDSEMRVDSRRNAMNSTNLKIFVGLPRTVLGKVPSRSL